MIGLGKWEATVSAMMIKVSGIVEVSEKDGKYDFKFNLPEKFKNVKITCKSVEEIGNDTLVATGEASAFPGKPFVVTAVFTDSTVSGSIKCAGFTAKIKNGRKIG